MREPVPHKTFRRRRLGVVAGAALLLAPLGNLTSSAAHEQRPPAAVAGPIGEFTPLEPSINISWLLPNVSQWNAQVIEESKKHHIDPEFPAIIMQIESGGVADAQSYADAIGLMQVVPSSGGLEVARWRNMPGAAEANPKDPNDPFINNLRQMLRDPKTNISFGVEYLAHQLKVFGKAEHGPSWNESIKLAATAYNGGAGAARNVIKTGRGVDAQNEGYWRAALGMWQERHQEVSPTYQKYISGDLRQEAKLTLANFNGK